MTRRLCLTAVVFCALLPGALYAQYGASIQTMSTYDDNSFSFRDKRADVYHQVFLSLSRDFSTDYSFHQAFYYGALVAFRTYSGRTYHQHMAGLYSSWQLDYRGDDEEEESSDEVAADSLDEGASDEETGEDEDSLDTGDEEDGGDEETGTDSSGTVTRNVRSGRPAPQWMAFAPADEPAFNDSLVTYLILKPAVSGRFDKAEYAFYDFGKVALSATLRRHIVGPLMGRLQYEAGFKSYPSFTQFTHVEQAGVVTLNTRLAPAFELFGSASLGYKIYTEKVSDTVFLSNGNSGKGKGGVKPKKTIISQYSTPSASQITLGLGTVLSAGAGTRLTLSYLRRINPSNTARYLDPRGIIGASEDDVFEDVYGYQGDEALCLLESSGPWSTTVTVEAGFERRIYPRPATTLAGEALEAFPQRIDARGTLEARVMLPIARAADGSTRFAAGLAYRYLRNQSRDEYHDYHTHQGMLVLEASL